MHECQLLSDDVIQLYDYVLPTSYIQSSATNIFICRNEMRLAWKSIDELLHKPGKVGM